MVAVALPSHTTLSSHEPSEERYLLLVLSEGDRELLLSGELDLVASWERAHLVAYACEGGVWELDLSELEDLEEWATGQTP